MAVKAGAKGNLAPHTLEPLSCERLLGATWVASERGRHGWRGEKVGTRQLWRVSPKLGDGWGKGADGSPFGGTFGGRAKGRHEGGQVREGRDSWAVG